MAQESNKKLAHEIVIPTARPRCGVIMPISSMVDYPESHWADVYSIIRDAVAGSGLDANLVSYADESAFIHKTIVQNLYDNPIVICDVSGKNPNVMFELGLRLAFDKPTIIVKDDATTYSFDTGPIEHLPYPRDLRFGKIVEFKAKLTAKIIATLEAAKDSTYSTFLGHFGKFTVAKLDEKEVSGQEFVLEELRTIRQSLDQLAQKPPQVEGDLSRRITTFAKLPEGVTSTQFHQALIKSIRGIAGLSSSTSNGKIRLQFRLSPDAPPSTESKILEICRNPERISITVGNTGVGGVVADPGKAE